MTTPAKPPGGARAQLVAGASDVNVGQWRGPQFYWVCLGSAPDADWRVEAEGVAPVHCELLWDGAGLYVHDRLRLGCTYIENRRVDSWSPLSGSHLLRLGAAAIWVQAEHQVAEMPEASALRWVQEEIERRRQTSASAPADRSRWASAAKKILCACLGIGTAASLDPWA